MLSLLAVTVICGEEGLDTVDGGCDVRDALLALCASSRALRARALTVN